MMRSWESEKPRFIRGVFLLAAEMRFDGEAAGLGDDSIAFYSRLGEVSIYRFSGDGKATLINAGDVYDSLIKGMSEGEVEGLGSRSEFIEQNKGTDATSLFDPDWGLFPGGSIEDACVILIQSILEHKELGE